MFCCLSSSNFSHVSKVLIQNNAKRIIMFRRTVLLLFVKALNWPFQPMLFCLRNTLTNIHKLHWNFSSTSKKKSGRFTHKQTNCLNTFDLIVASRKHETLQFYLLTTVLFLYIFMSENFRLGDVFLFDMQKVEEWVCSTHTQTNCLDTFNPPACNSLIEKRELFCPNRDIRDTWNKGNKSISKIKLVGGNPTLLEIIGSVYWEFFFFFHVADMDRKSQEINNVRWSKDGNQCISDWCCTRYRNISHPQETRHSSFCFPPQVHDPKHVVLHISCSFQLNTNTVTSTGVKCWEVTTDQLVLWFFFSLPAWPKRQTWLAIKVYLWGLFC